MGKKSDDGANGYPEDWEPPWMNSAHDRKTPYSEEELELFAEGFISSMSDTEALRSAIEKEGIVDVKEAVKEAFRKRDERNLVNIIFKGSIH